MSTGTPQELAARLRTLAGTTIDEIRVVGDEVVMSLDAAELVAGKLAAADQDDAAMSEKLEALAGTRARIQRRLAALQGR